MLRYLFGIAGRLSRLHYFVLTLVVNLGLFVVIALELFLSFGSMAAKDSTALDTGDPLTLTAMNITIILASVILICITIRRFHDLDRSGWQILTLAIPVYNLYIGLVLNFCRGTSGPNRFGPDPLKKHGSGNQSPPLTTDEVMKGYRAIQPR